MNDIRYEGKSQLMASLLTVHSQINGLFRDGVVAIDQENEGVYIIPKLFYHLFYDWETSSIPDEGTDIPCLYKFVDGVRFYTYDLLKGDSDD